MVQISVSIIHKKKKLHPPACSSRIDPVPDVVDSDLWDTNFPSRSDIDDFQSRNNRYRSSWCRPSYIPISFILVLIFLVVLLPLVDHNELKSSTGRRRNVLCIDTCIINLVESIPEGLNYSSGSVSYPSTYEVWKRLINKANVSIDIASYYWTLRKTDVCPHPSSYQGDEIYNELLNAGLYRNISITIAQNMPTEYQPNPDTEYLVKVKAANVTSLNFDKIIGAGVLHTKFWIVDRRHVYLGSANMDWRSLTQVKELGAVLYDCPCLAEDLRKVFKVYLEVGKTSSVPEDWPPSYSTMFNKETPMNVSLNGTATRVYLSSSPPEFSPNGRTDDISAILDVIDKAEKFIYIAVMDYFPLMIYTPHIEYWPVIDDALRIAVVDKGVHLCLLVSQWNHSRPMAINFLNSLLSLDSLNKNVSVEVKLFKVPSNSSQIDIPFARVNHNKYMVTDNVAYIGTSNWSGDYFVNTAGVGLVISHDENLRYKLQEIFERDWFSQYATDLSSFN